MWKVSDHSWFLFVCFYALLANLPVWAASYLFQIDLKGWFAPEYLLAGLAALWLPRALAALLLLVLMAGDAVDAVGSSYLLSPTDCLKSLGSLAELPLNRLVWVGLCFALGIAVAATAAFFPHRQLRRTWGPRIAGCLGLVLFVFAAADGYAICEKFGQVPNLLRLGPQADGQNAAFIERRMLARYPTIRLVRDELLYRAQKRAGSPAEADASAIPSAAALADFLVRGAPLASPRAMPNLVLILVESWGQANDSSIRNALVHWYNQPDLEARYRPLQGTVPFYGATVAGEARELCGNTMGFQIEEASAQRLAQCLPERLRKLGYRTMAVHGMNARMFDRRNWYGTIGFDEAWFEDDLKGQGLPSCLGAFIGICDASIAQWIGDRLHRDAPGPEFAYWVTLNSHLPVPVPTGVDDPANCAASAMLGRSAPFCSWYQLIANVHRSVYQMAMSALARPTVFVVVGDHAPPFAAPDLKAQFAASVVPYVLLIPHAVDRGANRLNQAETSPGKPAARVPGAVAQGGS